jgi:S1-C subfamily serine protease
MGAAVPAAALASTALPSLQAWKEQSISQEEMLASLRGQVEELQSNQGELGYRLADQEGLSFANYTEMEDLRRSLDEALSVEDELRTELHTYRAQLKSQTIALNSAHKANDPKSIRESLRRDILRPVFQLSGTDAVGSAVLIHEDKEGPGHSYYALTSYHVVRDILSERPGVEDYYAEAIDAFFERDAGEVIAEARLIAENVPADLALIRIDAGESLGQVAQLAPIERAEEIKSFSPIYTVGCPLGTAAQATHGEVTRRHWEVSGEPLWMISSPAFFGNSGGGVFLEETHELVGIFAKIYTHGSFRPQVVTHMGLAVPLQVLHSWLRDAGFASLLPASEAGSLAMAEEASCEQ